MNVTYGLSVQVSFELSEYTAEVDGIGTLRILNAIRTCELEKKCRFYQVQTPPCVGPPWH